MGAIGMIDLTLLTYQASGHSVGPDNANAPAALAADTASRSGADTEERTSRAHKG